MPAGTRVRRLRASGSQQPMKVGRPGGGISCGGRDGSVSAGALPIPGPPFRAIPEPLAALTFGAFCAPSGT